METIKAPEPNNLLEGLLYTRYGIKDRIQQIKTRLELLSERLGIVPDIFPCEGPISDPVEGFIQIDARNNSNMSSELYTIETLVTALEQL